MAEFGISAVALPIVDAPNHPPIDNRRRTIMFNTHTDFALNKFDKTAIVCQCVSGPNIRLTREDFASEEEFIYWKNWSDSDYKEIDCTGREDDACLSLENQRGIQVPSAEDVVLAPYIEAEHRERRRRMLEQVRCSLTSKQYHRLWMYHVDHLSIPEIAAVEKVSPRAIYACFEIIERIVNKL